jgi:hypothetical protein
VDNGSCPILEHASRAHVPIFTLSSVSALYIQECDVEAEGLLWDNTWCCKILENRRGSTVRECMPANFIHLDGRLRLARTLNLGLERFFIDMSSFGCHLKKKSGLLGKHVCKTCVDIDLSCLSVTSQSNSTFPPNPSQIMAYPVLLQYILAG